MGCGGLRVGVWVGVGVAVVVVVGVVVEGVTAVGVMMMPPLGQALRSLVHQQVERCLRECRRVWLRYNHELLVRWVQLVMQSHQPAMQ